VEADKCGKSKDLGTGEIRFFLAMFMGKCNRVNSFIYVGISILKLRS
jgi:hypothetical protein